MAKSIMIQGTMSNAGKSIICTALCRIFKQDGYNVAPFKSQNMSLNSYITEDGFEMGRAQAVQAEAAGIKPSVFMNPILLKPTNDTGSQVVMNGKVLGNMQSYDYFEYKKEIIPNIMAAYNKLDSEYDIVVIEGAGSPVEINLKDNDIVNMGIAKMTKSPVLLIGDIDRGGVFAQLFGTLALLETDERCFIKGMLINKFRGDVSLLTPGLDMFTDRIKDLSDAPFVGVIPYSSADIDDEDSLSERMTYQKTIKNTDIAVIKFPKISNFTDLNPFERFDGVSLRYVSSANELKNPDMIILPGTKNTIADLKWLRQNGLESMILKAAEKNTIIFGICGGYQMLGANISDPYGVEDGGSINGLNLLNMDTVFEKEKTQTQINGRIEGLTGELSSLNGLDFSGYEIHMGKSSEQRKISCNKNIYGTYIHGIFDKGSIASEILSVISRNKGIDTLDAKDFNINEYKEKQYDKLADDVRGAIDMKKIYEILENGI